MGTNHMAKATKRSLPVVAPPYTVTLELSQREAEVLTRVLGSIAGPLDGPRSLTSGIYGDLRAAGVASDRNSGFDRYPHLESKNG